MDDQTVCEVVNWLKDNKNNEELFDDDVAPYGAISGTPAEMFFTFLANPEVIIQDDQNCDKPRVPNGCNFGHTAGMTKSALCNKPKVLGSNRCQFHNQPVFCEKVWDYIQNYHAALNNMCK